MPRRGRGLGPVCSPRALSNRMPHFIVDVEADGPAPGLYSMVSFAAIELTAAGPGQSFVGEVAPISDRYVESALAACRLSREATLRYDPPELVMTRFVQWLATFDSEDRFVFISDNPAFDWQFVNYYLHAFTGGNPFGHTARRIGDFAAGLERNFTASSRWKRLRRTPHTHHPLDDVRGNAEALYALAQRHGVPLPFK